MSFLAKVLSRNLEESTVPIPTNEKEATDPSVEKIASKRDSDGASVYTVEQTTLEDPTLNPGVLTFEEGAQHLLYSLRALLTRCTVQMLLEEWVVISECSVALCLCMF